MKMKLQNMLTVLSILLLASCTQDSIEGMEAPVGTYENVTEMESQMLDIVNQHRAEMGLSPFQFSKVAYDCANAHTDYMISQGQISHDNFMARATMIEAEANAQMVEENVAKGYTSTQLALKAWLNSPDHRKPLEGDLNYTGISIKVDASGNLYYTELFYR